MIAIVNWGNKYIIGGGESAANGIYQLLKSENIDVNLFYAENKSRQKSFDSDKPIRVPFYYTSTTRDSRLFFTTAKRLLKWGSIFLFEIIVFFKTFKSGYNQFILGESFFLAFLLATFTSNKVFLRLHGPIKSNFFKKLVRKSVVIIANGSSYADTINKFPDNTVVNLDPPLPDYYFNLVNNRNRSILNSYNVGYVGRLEEIKGIDLIPEYMDRIRGFIDISNLFIIGDGSYKNKLGEIFAKITGVDCWHLLPMSRFDCADFLSRNVDFLIIPSRFDNSPNVLREALALGLNVFVSDGVHMDDKLSNNNHIICLSAISDAGVERIVRFNTSSSYKSLGNDQWLRLLCISND